MTQTKTKIFEVAKVNLFRKKGYSDPIYYFPFVSLYSYGYSAPDRVSVPTKKGQTPRMNASEEGW